MSTLGCLVVSLGSLLPSGKAAFVGLAFDCRFGGRIVDLVFWHRFAGRVVGLVSFF